jgi:tubulin alpha
MNMHTIYDNEALYRQCNRLYGARFAPSYKHLNQLIAMSMSSCTASLRFDGQLNVDLNEFQTNLVPIPTLNNMFASLAPLDMDEDKEVMSTKDITMQAFLPEAFMCSVDPFAWANTWPVEENAETWPQAPWLKEAEENAGVVTSNGDIPPEDSWIINHKFLACCVMYRGDLMPATINRAMQDLTKIKNPQFAPWVPSGFKVGINSPPMRTPAHWPTKDMSRSLCCTINNTVICEKLKQVVRNYRFIQDMAGYEVWTIVGGIEQQLLDGAKNGICDQISQYEYCMSGINNVDIDDIKKKLEERPQPLGNF